jgi:predicted transcriptional regulator
MTETLSIRIDSETRKRLDALAARSHKSAEALAEEAITQLLDVEAWQVAEIEAGIADIDAGRSVPHDDVVAWLKTWGTSSEGKEPQ